MLDFIFSATKEAIVVHVIVSSKYVNLNILVSQYPSLLGYLTFLSFISGTSGHFSLEIWKKY